MNSCSQELPVCVEKKHHKETILVSQITIPMSVLSQIIISRNIVSQMIISMSIVSQMIYMNIVSQIMISMNIVSLIMLSLNVVSQIMIYMIIVSQIIISKNIVSQIMTTTIFCVLYCCLFYWLNCCIKHTFQSQYLDNYWHLRMSVLDCPGKYEWKFKWLNEKVKIF